MIAIIDYGMGNIHSVSKALEICGAKTILTNNPEEISQCDGIVLPGVGAFDDAMLELNNKGLSSVIKEHIRKKKIFLGICLGMQLLFEGSQEAKKESGLGIFKGTVKKFVAKKGLKVPHMGWNQIKIAQSECPLLEGILDDSYVYFCHSYYSEALEKSVIAAATDYGVNFASIVWQDNVYGVQFHPEKSQDIGLRMLKNFINEQITYGVRH